MCLCVRLDVGALVKSPAWSCFVSLTILVCRIEGEEAVARFSRGLNTMAYKMVRTTEEKGRILTKTSSKPSHTVEIPMLVAWSTKVCTGRTKGR